MIAKLQGGVSLQQACNKIEKQSQKCEAGLTPKVLGRQEENQDWNKNTALSLQQMGIQITNNKCMPRGRKEINTKNKIVYLKLNKIQYLVQHGFKNLQ